LKELDCGEKKADGGAGAFTRSALYPFRVVRSLIYLLVAKGYAVRLAVLSSPSESSRVVALRLSLRAPSALLFRLYSKNRLLCSSSSREVANLAALVTIPAHGEVAEAKRGRRRETVAAGSDRRCPSSTFSHGLSHPSSLAFRCLEHLSPTSVPRTVPRFRIETSTSLLLVVSLQAKRAVSGCRARSSL
jgi:hypothetical protein